MCYKYEKILYFVHIMYNVNSIISLRVFIMYFNVGKVLLLLVFNITHKIVRMKKQNDFTDILHEPQ